MNDFTIDPAVGTLLAAAFALLFASAALHKLLDLERNAEVIAAYAVVPSVLSRLAGLVPLIELAIGIGLLVGAWRARAALAAALALVAYAAAIATNLRRGRLDLSCGCGGANDRRPIAAWMVWRNLALAMLVAVLLLPSASRRLDVTDALTILGGVLVLVLLYVSVDTLLSRVAPRAAALRDSS